MRYRSLPSTGALACALLLVLPAITQAVPLQNDTASATAVPLEKPHPPPKKPTPTPTPTPIPTPTPTPEPTPTPTPIGTVLWTADAENDMNHEWAETNDMGINGGAGTVTSPTTEANATRTSRQSTIHAQGGSAYRFQIQATDRDYYNKSTRQRTELGMSNPSKSMPDGIDRLFREGDDRWISFQVYLPTDFALDRVSNSITQLKQVAGSCGGCGSPAMVMDGSLNAWRLFRGNDVTGGSGLTAQFPALKNVWAKQTLHVKFSPDPTIGFIEWYGDNGDGTGMRTVLPKLMTWTMKRDNANHGDPFGSGPALPSHTRLGIYRQIYDVTSDVYIDGYTVATSRAAAEAHAFGP